MFMRSFFKLNNQSIEEREENVMFQDHQCNLPKHTADEQAAKLRLTKRRCLSAAEIVVSLAFLLFYIITFTPESTRICTLVNIITMAGVSNEKPIAEMPS